jgi:hypothetical protein
MGRGPVGVALAMLSLLAAGCPLPRQYEGPIAVDHGGLAARVERLCRAGLSDEATGAACLAGEEDGGAGAGGGGGGAGAIDAGGASVDAIGDGAGADGPGVTSAADGAAGEAGQVTADGQRVAADG